MTDTLAQITLGELGAFFGGLGAFIAALWAVTSYVLSRRQTKFQESIRASVLGMAKSAIEARIAGLDPKSYHTHDTEIKASMQHFNVPMLPNAELGICENLYMAIVFHSHECTTLSLRTTGFAYLPPHRHHRAAELIEVVEGTVTHQETGRVYRAGETWEIPIMEWHSAVFSDGFCGFVKCRPPLPTAADSPPNLEGMEKAFLSNPVKP